jgi:hypothetical protein
MSAMAAEAIAAVSLTVLRAICMERLLRLIVGTKTRQA